MLSNRSGKENSKLDEQLFSTGKISHLEKMDPSLENGFRIIYHKEVPMEIRLMEGETAEGGSEEMINAKILVQGEV